jgi:uncharacterized protein DUF1566
MRKSLMGFVGAGLLWAGALHAGTPPAPPGPKKCADELNQCTAQLTTCTNDLGTCNTGAAACAANLAQCQAQLGAGVGAGAAPRLVDNGDGTVTDTKTGLTWEKKTTDGSVHDVSQTFSWSSSGSAFDGTAKTAFLDKLNDVAGSGAHCFAGYCDWRLPSEDGENTPGGPRELETILDLTQGYCGGGPGGTSCVLPGLGPTRADYHWSATTYAGDPTGVYYVDFYDGRVHAGYKTNSHYVRAVRGGL